MPSNETIKELEIQSVLFQRTPNGPAETGVLVGHQIIDMDGHVVKRLWNYDRSFPQLLAHVYEVQIKKGGKL